MPGASWVARYAWLMPYHIAKSGDEYCVLKDEDGKKMGCHPTEARAKKQLAALNIAMKKEKATADEWTAAMTALTDEYWTQRLEGKAQPC